jgi:hypothetical protein
MAVLRRRMELIDSSSSSSSDEEQIGDSYEPQLADVKTEDPIPGKMAMTFILN